MTGAQRPVFGVDAPPPVAKGDQQLVDAGWQAACGHVRHVSFDGPLGPLWPGLTYGLLPRAEAMARLGECDACRPPDQLGLAL